MAGREKRISNFRFWEAGPLYQKSYADMDKYLQFLKSTQLPAFPEGAYLQHVASYKASPTLWEDGTFLLTASKIPRNYQNWNSLMQSSSRIT